ncbi:MAG: transcriptional coactivator p15/PC4 family protein [Candidatus Paceibacterota bacterium]
MKDKKQDKELVLAEIPKGNFKIRITVSHFNGTKLAHLREWFKDPDGNMKPGKNGLTFGSIDSFQAFVRSILVAEKKVVKALSK